MARVFLKKDHHETVDKGETLELTEEMLSWPIQRYGCFISQRAEPAYKNALRALLALDPFESVFCIETDVNNKVFHFAKRCWGWILLNDKVVKSFSHSKEEGRLPFDGLFDWPEIEDFGPIYEWTVDDWKKFFMEGINNEASADLAIAQKNANEANEELIKQEKLTKHILIALKNVGQ